MFFCFFCFLKLPMANTKTNPPNVALDKIAQLLNNIVDESKLASIFRHGHVIQSCSVQSESKESGGKM